MTDPVPVRRGGNQNNSNNTEHSFFVKGEDTKEPAANSYERVGGEEDVFIVNGQNGSFQLNRKTLKQTLAELKTQSAISIRQLSPEYTESFKSVMEALRLLYGSQALYDLVLTDIRNVFDDVKDVKPGTVAAFFIGCFNDDKFPGPIGCSPKCAASLPPTEGTPGYANCDDLVLIYSDGLFSSLNEKRSTHAYIYVEDNDFPGFSLENINQLKEAGIENASLVFGNQDGSYREVTGVLNVNQLPRRSDDNMKLQQTNTQQEVNNTSSSGDNTGAGIAFAIVIIIIIILLLVILFRNFQ